MKKEFFMGLLAEAHRVKGVRCKCQGKKRRK